jgi:hypothetical protein
MQLTDFLVPSTIVATVLIVLGLGPLTWYLIKSNRAWEAKMLADWASEDGAQIIAARRVLFFDGCGFGGRRAPAGFRATICTKDGVRRTGLLRFPCNNNNSWDRKGTFVSDSAPMDSHNPLMPDV